MLDQDFVGDINALRKAAVRNHINVLMLLLEDGRADPGADRSVALRLAAWKGSVEAVNLLLRDGRADPAAINNSAIICASSSGKADVVRLLLKDVRVDPAANNNRAIYAAAKSGHVETVRILLQDDRVDGTVAILESQDRVVHLLAENKICGVEKNKAIYGKYRPKIVEKYKILCWERKKKIIATMWCMMHIGETLKIFFYKKLIIFDIGWNDIFFPIQNIMMNEELNWE